MLASLVLGATAACTAQTALALIGREFALRGAPLMDLLRYISSIDAVVGLVALGFAFCLMHAEPVIGFDAGVDLQWFVLSLGIGIAMGFMLYLLTRVRCREEELLIFVVGMVTFSSGIALYLELSPLFVNATMGITMANLPGSKDRIFNLVAQLERPFYIVFLILAGAIWRPGSPWALPLAALYLSLRLVGKLGGGYLAARLATRRLPPPSRPRDGPRLPGGDRRGHGHGLLPAGLDRADQRGGDHRADRRDRERAGQPLPGQARAAYGRRDRAMIRILALAFVILFMLLALFPFSDVAVFADARSTMTFGFLLLAAYLVGDVLSRFKIPKITGYILAGIVFGPHAFELVSTAAVRELKLIDDLALTFIALAAGGELRLEELRQRRRSITLNVLFQAVIVFVGVAGFTLAARSLLPFLEARSFAEILAVAALLGVFAMARSPSSAIAIISECKARGPFTEMVLGVTVVMDVLVIVIFAAVVSISQTLVTPGSQLDFGFVVMVVVQLLGSILGGVVLGCLISLYIRYVEAELVVFILALAFLVTFFSGQFALLLDRLYSLPLHLEPLLICVTAGFWVRNFSRGGGLFMENIDRSSLPIYVIFFSLTGAALNLDALRQTWLIAVLLVVVRCLLIWLGAYLGTSLSGDPPRFRKMAGLSFVTQAGVSLGLAGIVMSRFPDWGAALATTIVAVIALNQLIGPIAFKFALGAVGEARAIPRR